MNNIAWKGLSHCVVNQEISKPSPWGIIGNSVGEGDLKDQRTLCGGVWIFSGTMHSFKGTQPWEIARDPLEK